MGLETAKRIIVVSLILSLLMPTAFAANSSKKNVNNLQCARLLSLSIPNASGPLNRADIVSDSDKKLDFIYELKSNGSISESSDPIDFIFVAETAETMGQDFDGNKVSDTVKNRRIDAMKQSLRSLTSFIKNRNLRKEDKDRVALIEFYNDAKTYTDARTLEGLTDNYDQLIGNINNLIEVNNPKDPNKSRGIGKNFGRAFAEANKLILEDQSLVLAAPRHLTIKQNNESKQAPKLNLTWENDVVLSQPVRFQIFRKVEGSDFVKIAETASTSFLDNSVKANTQYSYYVVTVTSPDGKEITSNPSEVMSATTRIDQNKPVTPAEFRISQRSDTHVTLAWQEMYDNLGISHYNVYLNDIFFARTFRTTMKVELASLPLGNHRFNVRAVDLAGNLSGSTTGVNVQAQRGTADSAMFYYQYDGFSIPEMDYKSTAGNQWATVQMDVTGVFGLFSKRLKATQPFHTRFRYVDNRNNHFPLNPDHFDAYQPGDSTKPIGSNPKPLTVYDESNAFFANKLTHADYFVRNPSVIKWTTPIITGQPARQVLQYRESAANSIPETEHDVEYFSKANAMDDVQDPIRDELPQGNHDSFTIYYKNPPGEANPVPLLRLKIKDLNNPDDIVVPMKESNIYGYHYATVDLDDSISVDGIQFSIQSKPGVQNVETILPGSLNGGVFTYFPEQRALRPVNPNKNSLAVVYYHSLRLTNDGAGVSSSVHRNPHIHYKLSKSGSDFVAGVRMKPSIVAGYHYLTIDLDNYNVIEHATFSNGSNPLNVAEANNRRILNRVLKPGFNLYNPRLSLGNRVQFTSPAEIMQAYTRVYYKSDEISPTFNNQLGNRTIHSSIPNPFVTYNAPGLSRTEVPGVPMIPSVISGYHTLIIPLQQETRVSGVQFNNEQRSKSQPETGQSLTLYEDHSVYYPIGMHLKNGVPDIISGRFNRSTLSQSETHVATVYFRNGSSRNNASRTSFEPIRSSVKLEYKPKGVAIDSNTGINEMYPSEVKGYDKRMIAWTGSPKLNVTFRSSSSPQVHTAELDGSGVYTFDPLASESQRLHNGKPRDLDSGMRQKVIIFLSDGLPNIPHSESGKSYRLEPNGPNITATGQIRSNPFEKRQGYDYAIKEMEKLVALGAVMNVIAIGSERAINKDAAAIDLQFLELLAAYGKGKFVKAQNYWKLYNDVLQIGEDLLPNVFQDVVINQRLPEGVRLAGNKSLGDVELDGKIVTNAVRIEDRLMTIRFDQLTLRTGGSARLKVSLESIFGQSTTLAPAQLRFEIQDTTCRIAANDHFHLAISAVTYDSYGNKYLGDLNGNIYRFGKVGANTNYPPSSLQWTLSPYGKKGNQFPVKQIQLAERDTLVRVAHYRTNQWTTWNLLPTVPSNILISGRNNQTLSMRPGESSINRVIRPASIRSIQGGLWRMPQVNNKPLTMNELSIFKDFDADYISHYQYSADNGKSWFDWRPTGSGNIAIPARKNKQLFKFRALTTAISGSPMAGNHMSTNIQLAEPKPEPPKNVAPTVQLEQVNQADLIVQNVKFANKENDLLVRLSITDDQPVRNTFDLRIAGKKINSPHMKIFDTNGGKTKTIQLEWSKLFPNPAQRQGRKTISLSYVDAGGLKANVQRDVNLNVGPGVVLVNRTEVTGKTHNTPVIVRVRWSSAIPDMTVSQAEYQIINRNIGFNGKAPSPDPKQWKRLGSNKLTIVSEGRNFVYIRVRDRENLNSSENGYSEINKLNPIDVRINYLIGSH